MKRHWMAIAAGALLGLFLVCIAVVASAMSHGWDQYRDHANINGRNCHRITAHTWRCP